MTTSDTFEGGALVEEDAATERPEAATIEARKGLSVLIAEDNEINALLARSLLTKLGHWPTTAANGTAALEAWQAARSAGSPHDLILMDLHMPGLDGLEAAQRIRSAEAGSARRTPIIALTANAFAEDREACLAAGMDGFLVKPLDREQLISALQTLSKTRRLAA
jgi:CheY-like chemotaxis protein